MSKNKESERVQATLRGKAAWLYKNIDSGMKSKAIEIGLILLAKDKNWKKIFFEDLEMVDEKQIESVETESDTKPKELKNTEKLSFS
jgi:hypothetical protein